MSSCVSSQAVFAVFCIQGVLAFSIAFKTVSNFLAHAVKVAQLRRTGAAAGGASAWSAEGVWVLTGALGKPGTEGRCLLGALRME